MADRDEQRDGAPALASARAGAAGRPLRNVVVTCDDPFGVPLLLHELLMQTADITAIVLAQWKGQDSARKAARKWLGAMGWGPFAQLLGRYGAVRAKGAAACFVGAWRPLTVKGVAREHAIPLVEMADINADESLAWFRSEGPDLIVSVACPQIFGKTLLELPTLGCINIHSGPLPRYRGMLPTFWVLLNNERATAVTVHFMRPEIDAGEIILQQEVPIRPGQSQHELMLQCKRVGADLLAETLHGFRTDTVTTEPNPADASSYFSFPTADDGRRFREAGCQWF